MPALTKENLREILVALCHQMIMKNQIPPNTNKEDLINTVTEKLMPIFQQNPVDVRALKDEPKLMVALKISLVSEFLNKNVPEFKLDPTKKIAYEKLFDEKMTPEELKNQFKLILGAIGKKAPQLKLDSKTINKLADELVDTLVDQRKKDFDFAPKPAFSQKNTIDLFAEMTASLASLNGGVNILGQPGEVPRTVEFIMGNLQGFALAEVSEEQPATYMTNQNVAQPGKEDPNSSIVLSNTLSNDSLPDEIENVIESIIHTPPSPFSHKNTPNGM